MSGEMGEPQMNTNEHRWSAGFQRALWAATTWQAPAAAGALSEKSVGKQRNIRRSIESNEYSSLFSNIFFREPEGPAADLGALGGSVPSVCSVLKNVLIGVHRCSSVVSKSFLVLLVLFSSFAQAQADAPLLFMTDFGTTDDSVSICKGVMLGIAPDLRIVDITHEVTPFSILDGARFLAGASPYYPAGSVFVVVVDPGVGSVRKPVVIKTKKGQYFVLPDNGLITLVADRDGVETAREITNTSWMIGSALSSTFHGRDIFSPVGAHIARGKNWTDVGPEIKDLVRLKVAAPFLDENGIHGEIIALDGPYGNVITNIDADVFRKLGYQLGEKIPVRIGEREFPVPFVKTFSDVPLKEPLLYVDSRGHVGLALNQASFAASNKIEIPVAIFIPTKQ